MPRQRIAAGRTALGGFHPAPPNPVGSHYVFLQIVCLERYLKRGWSEVARLASWGESRWLILGNDSAPKPLDLNAIRRIVEPIVSQKERAARYAPSGARSGHSLRWRASRHRERSR